MIHLCVQLYAKIEMIIIIINVSECLYCRMGSERLAGWLANRIYGRKGVGSAPARRPPRSGPWRAAYLECQIPGCPALVCLFLTSGPSGLQNGLWSLQALSISVICHDIWHPYVLTKKLIPNTIPLADDTFMYQSACTVVLRVVHR